VWYPRIHIATVLVLTALEKSWSVLFPTPLKVCFEHEEQRDKLTRGLAEEVAWETVRLDFWWTPRMFRLVRMFAAKSFATP